VEYPKLEQVKECSKGPADFLLHILHVLPQKQNSIEALLHPYASQILREMEACCERLNEQQFII
jgi:hypothetical protein